VTIITIATASTTAAASSSTSTIIIALNSSTAYSVGVTILSEGIICGFSAIVGTACVAIMESFDGLARFPRCPGQFSLHVGLKIGALKYVYHIPSSEPVKPPRRLPRPPLPPLCAGSVGAAFGASRFPERPLGFSAILGGGDGSLSES
jgi:hypothetical protein